jgi:hypothetical protein
MREELESASAGLDFPESKRPRPVSPVGTPEFDIDQEVIVW